MRGHHTSNAGLVTDVVGRPRLRRRAEPAASPAPLVTPGRVVCL